ncbi:hypothetical protein D3C75_1003950 [compost metagenome]
MANRGGLRGGDFTLVYETELGEELDGIFARATGHAPDALLTGNGLQRHRNQRAKPFILHGRVHRHKAN